ncbi:MAG: putative membrane protein YczE [Verrucomicrobiales bacterium]
MTATSTVGPFLVYNVREPKTRRVGSLFLGLVFFGIALGLSVEANLGVNPWTVFHGGLSKNLGITIGAATILVGAILLLSFPLLKQPLGLGTLLNVLVIGTVTDLTLLVVPDLTNLPARLAALAVAPALIGLGSGFYIGAGLGPGPRDGIMTTLERHGLPVWLARAIVELGALTIGAFLGGNVGWGTVWMATTVGLWVQFFLLRLRFDPVS